MKQKKEKTRMLTIVDAAPLGSLADIFRQAGIVPSDGKDPSSSPVENMPSSAAKTELVPPQRLRIRCERKHRGGKTVTLVEGLTADVPELENLLKRMKTALGCGGTVENDVLVLQGNIEGRVRAWVETNMRNPEK